MKRKKELLFFNIATVQQQCIKKTITPISNLYQENQSSLHVPAFFKIAFCVTRRPRPRYITKQVGKRRTQLALLQGNQRLLPIRFPTGKNFGTVFYLAFE